jgi:hypothetical protein
VVLNRIWMALVLVALGVLIWLNLPMAKPPTCKELMHRYNSPARASMKPAERVDALECEMKALEELKRTLEAL